MAKINDCTIEAINAHSQAIFEAYKIVQKRGSAHCPFHNDKNASFVLKPDTENRWYWKCMACGKSGHDVIDFVMAIEGVDFPTAARKCMAIAGIVELNDFADTPARIALRPTPPPPPPPPHYLNDVAAVMAGDVASTALYDFLCGIADTAAVVAVMKEYNVGRGHSLNRDFAPTGHPSRLMGTDMCTAFSYLNADGDVEVIKIVPYGADGHRLKMGNGAGEMCTYKPQGNVWPLFGAHLLADSPGKRVAIVESEKTAIIGALFLPEYIWLAVGGKANISPQNAKYDVLRGRAIHVFPDTDGVEAWRIAADNLRNRGFNVFYRDEIIGKLPPQSKMDIADVILYNLNNVNHETK